MRPVSQRTKRMKEPRTTTPGRSWRWEIRPRRIMMKIMQRAEMLIM